MKLTPGNLSWRKFFQTLLDRWLERSLSDVAGAVTFSAVLALFPFLLFLVAFGSLFIDPARAAAIVDSLSHFAPSAVTGLVAGRIRALSSSHNVGLLTGSLLAAIWSVSSGIVTLTSALNTIHGVRETRPFWRRRALAFGMTFLGVEVAVVGAFLTVFVRALARTVGGWPGAFVLAMRLPASALALMFLWAALDHLLPNVKRPFRLFTPGSVTSVLLWLIASWGFSQYVAHFGQYEVTYGALGGFAILLLWMWISAMTLLLGAEVNAVIAAVD